MVERSIHSHELKYTMSQVTAETGLGRSTIKTLHDLHLISLADGIGAGVKRISDADLNQLNQAAALLKLRHTPEQVVKILLNREKYLELLQEVIRCIAILNENPDDESLWENYSKAVLKMSDLDEAESRALNAILLEKNGLPGREVSRLLDRAYQKIGYAFIALMRLKTLEHESTS